MQCRGCDFDDFGGIYTSSDFKKELTETEKNDYAAAMYFMKPCIAHRAFNNPDI